MINPIKFFKREVNKDLRFPAMLLVIGFILVVLRAFWGIV